MADAQKIADGLTDAQRDMLAWAHDGFLLLRPGWTRWRLQRKGLVAPWLFKGSWTLTDLGFAVRDLLRAQADAPNPTPEES